MKKVLMAAVVVAAALIVSLSSVVVYADDGVGRLFYPADNWAGGSRLLYPADNGGGYIYANGGGGFYNNNAKYERLGANLGANLGALVDLFSKQSVEACTYVRGTHGSEWQCVRQTVKR